MAIISIPTSIGGVSIPGQLGKLVTGPLAALYGNPGLETVSYPQDLATDATKSHYVQFSIKEIIPAKYDTIRNLTQSVENITLEKTKEVATEAVTGLRTGLENAYKDPVGAAAKVGQATLDTASAVTETVQALILDKKTTDFKSVISLYMPDTITAQYNAEYTRIDLRGPGGVMGSRLGALQSLSEINGAIKDAKENGQSASAAISSDPAVLNTLLRFGAGAVRADPALASLALQSQGYAVNPQMQMLYQGLDFRSFQLSFIFTPSSRAEAKIVDNIIYQFKYYSAPSFQPGKAVSNLSMFLIPPAIFGVKFMIKNIENRYLPKYADCVLEHVDVNYSPNGWAAHTDGSPVQTQLNLIFKEIEVVDRGRLSTGYNDPLNERGLR